MKAQPIGRDKNKTRVRFADWLLVDEGSGNFRQIQAAAGDKDFFTAPDGKKYHVCYSHLQVRATAREVERLRERLGDTDNEGYYEKYHITKADGTPLPEEAVMFVLRIDTDRVARIAARAYADNTDNPQLARDLIRLCSEVEHPIIRPRKH